MSTRITAAESGAEAHQRGTCFVQPLQKAGHVDHGGRVEPVTSAVRVPGDGRSAACVLPGLVDRHFQVDESVDHRGIHARDDFGTHVFFDGPDAVFVPARNATVPSVVPAAQLAAANGLLQASFRGAAGRPGGTMADLAAGYRALRQVPNVEILIANFVVAILCASGFLSVGLTLLAATRLHGGIGAYGTLLAATGLCSAVTDVSLITVVQRRVPRQHLAKVLGLWEAGISGGTAVSAPLAAAVITLAGLTAAFALCGAALVTVALTSAWLLHRVTSDQPGDAVSQERWARS